ncbi:MAG: sigma-70 family RNA polymerase sigma factor [Candidatus Hydrogenedentes bacterium]|nr:sigma-70 family RNA polymerase sigma factor [Candidatus Hydrogenedentota bacterium]
MDDTRRDLLTREDWVAAVLARYEQPLVQYAYRIVHDVELARDVVQDTFLQLCRANRAKIEGQLGAWLYTVCRNRALTVRRKESRMTNLADKDVAVAPDDASAAAVQDETSRRVLAVLAKLPLEQQEAFRLKFQDDLNYREISRVMNVSLGKVSALMKDALNALRMELKSELNPARETKS